jgi:hypothetical protein
MASSKWLNYKMKKRKPEKTKTIIAIKGFTLLNRCEAILPCPQSPGAIATGGL